MNDFINWLEDKNITLIYSNISLSEIKDNSVLDSKIREIELSAENKPAYSRYTPSIHIDKRGIGLSAQGTWVDPKLMDMVYDFIRSNVDIKEHKNRGYVEVDKEWLNHNNIHKLGTLLITQKFYYHPEYSFIFGNSTISAQYKKVSFEEFEKCTLPFEKLLEFTAEISKDVHA